MRIKIAQYIDVDVPPGSTPDEAWELINAELAPGGDLRKNLDFVIESVTGGDGDDNYDHPLVDETIG
jgi:hypothetical protein